MTFRHVVLAVAIGSVVAAASAQTPSNHRGANSESTGDFNAQGEISANAVIGAKVRNTNRDTIGTVQDLYVDASGTIKTIVIAVGGFLGVGTKDVAVKWSDIRQTRDGKSAVLTTSLSREQLKAMPDYKSQRGQPSQAATPK